MIEKKSLQAVGMILVGVLALSAMDAAVKWLLIRDMSPFQIIAVRGWIITLFLLLSLLRQGSYALRTTRLRAHLVRTVIGFLAPVAFFISLKTVPLANATAIFFSATFFLAAGSALVLRERVGYHRWIAIVGGFAGVLVVTAPTSDVFQPASLLALVAGASYAVLVLTGRWLSTTETTFRLVFYYNAITTLLATVALPLVWRTPTLEEMGMILLVSILALIGYVFLTRAFTLGPVGLVAPFEYSALLWAVLFGFVFWGEMPESRVWLGLSIIISSGIYIVYRERQHSRQAATGSR
ncbi:MAG: DMT family transporter [Pseudomonadota bacterium]|nr:DMT family transporter [Pseudomonadota bacterium]